VSAKHKVASTCEQLGDEGRGEASGGRGGVAAPAVREVRGHELVAGACGIGDVDPAGGDELGEAVGVDDAAPAAQGDDDLADAERAERAVVELDPKRVNLLLGELQDTDVPEDGRVVGGVEVHRAKG
jgi:hypothetical protein